MDLGRERIEFNNYQQIVASLLNSAQFFTTFGRSSGKIWLIATTLKNAKPD